MPGRALASPVHFPEMSGFQGKSIIVLMPPDVGIFTEIRNNLQRLGFSVQMITGQPEAFRYRHFGERLGNLLRKLVGDGGYKRRLIQRHMKDQVDWSIAKAGRADFALVIRADCFTHAQLEAIRGKSDRCYAFHWDGVGRFPGVEERLRYFRKFYVFDPTDARPADGIFHLDSFWLEPAAEVASLSPASVDVYYIGTYDGRAPFLFETFERLRRQGQSLRAIIAGSSPGPRPSIAGVSFPEKWLTYAENLDLVPSARILLDVPHLDVHRGLSLRVFEALGFGKKLITTNPGVLRCDFYHPANIHLLTDDDAALDRFLSAPAVPVDPAIRLRHGFSSWLRRAFEMKDE